MKYVLGAGISGLLWAFYHREYQVLTDTLGRALTGSDPVVWLNATPHTARLLTDLGIAAAPVTKPIGYRVGNKTFGVGQMDPLDVDRVLLKKMVPWEALYAAQGLKARIELTTPSRRFTKDSEGITYYDVDVRRVADALLTAVHDRVHEGRRVVEVNKGGMATKSCGWEYEHLVSTVPAPLFARLWVPRTWAPRLHYCPVTYVVSAKGPDWWDESLAMAYEGDTEVPYCRVGRFGETFRYEVTGRLNDDVLDEWWSERTDVFVNPYGRIVQDTELQPPDVKVMFLGRAARWDYRGLIDRELEIVHAEVSSAEG